MDSRKKNIYLCYVYTLSLFPTYHNCISVFSIKRQEFPDANFETFRIYILQPYINSISWLCTAAVFCGNKHVRLRGKALEDKIRCQMSLWTMKWTKIDWNLIHLLILDRGLGFENVNKGGLRGGPRRPRPPPPLLRGNFFSFVNVCQMVRRALLLNYIFLNKHC